MDPVYSTTAIVAKGRGLERVSHEDGGSSSDDLFTTPFCSHSQLPFFYSIYFYPCAMCSTHGLTAPCAYRKDSTLLDTFEAYIELTTIE